METLSITELPKKSGIYKILNLQNNKFYIGSSKNIYMRCARHRSELLRNNHENKYLQNAFNKDYNFEFLVVELCNNEELVNKEQYYIDFLNPNYNFIRDVIRKTLSQESRNKISKSLKLAYKEGRKSKKPKNFKNVYGFDANGILLVQYQSKKEAARKENVGETAIHESIKFKNRIAANKIWRLKDQVFDYEPFVTLIDKNTNKTYSFVSYADAERQMNINKGTLAAYIFRKATRPLFKKYEIKTRKH